MFRPLHTALTVSLLSIYLSGASAETLSIPESEFSVPEEQMEQAETPQAQPESDMAAPETNKETFSVTLPGRGMSMEQVEERFGTPAEKNPAVGTPPISSWIYDKFTVYFESQYVIHAVFHKPK